jgi:hypothetical protein
VCSQLLEAASIFEVCDLSCTELLERLERVERAGPSSDLVEYRTFTLLPMIERDLQIAKISFLTQSTLDQWFQ